MGRFMRGISGTDEEQADLFTTSRSGNPQNLDAHSLEEFLNSPPCFGNFGKVFWSFLLTHLLCHLSGFLAPIATAEIYQPPAIPPAIPGPELCGSNTATSTSSRYAPTAVPFYSPSARRRNSIASSMARSTTKSSSSSNSSSSNSSNSGNSSNNSNNSTIL